MCSTCNDKLTTYKAVQAPARMLRDAVIRNAQISYEQTMWHAWHEYAQALEDCRKLKVYQTASKLKHQKRAQKRSNSIRKIVAAHAHL